MSSDGNSVIIEYKNGKPSHGCSRNSELHLTCGTEFKLTSAKARSRPFLGLKGVDVDWTTDRFDHHILNPSELILAKKSRSAYRLIEALKFVLRGYNLSYSL